MTDKIDTIFKKARHISLTHSEKSQGREMLFSYMRSNPVRNLGGDLPELQRMSFWSSINPFNLNLRTMPIILLISILVGGGAVLGAEQSLPGDTLYPVKVSVNEEVRAWFAVSDESKADWDSRRASRRLEEAEKLALQRGMSVEVRENLEARFETHAAKVEDRIAKFEADNDFEAAADVAANFETSMKAHERILGFIADRESKSEVRPLAQKVRSRINAAADAQASAKADTSIAMRAEIADDFPKTAAEGKLKAAENKLAEVKNYLNDNKDKFEAEIVAQAEGRIKLSEETIASGKVRMESDSNREAFMLFQKSINIAQEAKLLLEARLRLDIDLRLNNLESNIRKAIEDDYEDEEIEIEGKVKIDLGI